MTRGKNDINSIEPLGLTGGQTARLLGIGYTKFRDLRALLYDDGFPKPDPITKRTYKAAVIAWLDHRNGLSNYVLSTADRPAGRGDLDGGFAHG